MYVNFNTNGSTIQHLIDSIGNAPSLLHTKFQRPLSNTFEIMPNNMTKCWIA